MVDGVVPHPKTELRREILRARRAIPPEVRAAHSDGLRAHLRGLAQSGQTVCGYVPVGSEPGSIELIDDLVTAGVRVLLPVARTDGADVPLPLQWGEYRPGNLVTAQFGLREPAPPWLPAEAVADAVVVLVPALAVDRAGVRLGRGAGFYDRTLGLAGPAARLVALVRDEELVDRLPVDPHDVRMTHALTPRLGLVRLSGSSGPDVPAALR